MEEYFNALERRRDVLTPAEAVRDLSTEVDQAAAK